MIYNTLHIDQIIEQHEPHEKPGDDLGCSGRIDCFCSSSETHCITLATYTNPVISHELNEERTRL